MKSAGEPRGNCRSQLRTAMAFRMVCPRLSQQWPALNDLCPRLFQRKLFLNDLGPRLSQQKPPLNDLCPCSCFPICSVEPLREWGGVEGNEEK